METNIPSFEETLFEINLIVDKLKHATDGSERRDLLKQFRALLETVDVMSQK